MIVDVFAGPGGWDVGAHLAGLEQPIGLEWDKGACNTRAAAGHLTVRTDVAQYPPEVFAGADGLIASPPCQEFSTANTKRRGVDSDRGALVNEVMRWATAIRPRWIACEQVPGVLPIWRHFAHQLRGFGYDAHAAVLCAADYGVPQKRYRAILFARLDGPACWPTPTHCAAGSMFTQRSATIGDVTGRADALQPGSDEPAPTVHLGHDACGWKWSTGERLTPAELGVLQGFDRDYPWRGPHIGQQVGNAIPPPFAAAILTALTEDR